MYRLLALALALALSADRAFAGPLIIAGDPSRTIRVPLVASSPSSIFFHFRSPSSKHQTFEFEIEGPSGAVVSFASAKSVPRTTRDVSAKRGIIYPGLLYGQFGNSSKSVKIGSSSTGSGGGGGGSGFVCGCLTSQDIADFRDTFQRAGLNYSVAQICALFGNSNVCGATGGGGGIGGGLPTGNKVSLAAFVRDDACDTKAPVAVVKVDLSKVKTSDLLGQAVTIKSKFTSFEGNRRVKIKRRGEGKFKGSLLLAGPVSGVSFSGAIGEVNLTQWKGDTLRRDRSLKIADFVFYPPAGGTLWRIPLPGNVLSGGRGTFELRSNAVGHSICAPLVPKDQFFNGYPNNSRNGDEG